ncbi:MAG: Re/Si-specific NAD(P)(+) transhydrogenase subunit alpha [Deltaproteobacteria bacterium]|nr:MAG: Re/Si-specific NAD(P)(+) transhydrogenase subunit alpha [Deltaproteobacteria bacterium]
MKVGIPKEIVADERRVAGTPKTTKKLVGMGFEVMIEAGAGRAADYPDEAYTAVGATIVPDAKTLYGECDVVVKVEAPTPEEVPLMRKGLVLISFIYPKRSAALMDLLAAQGVTTLAMDMVPRITRAQKLDALSSMANIAGYRAIVEAANEYGSFFPSQFTAAGKVDPAKVLVIGAGVAGLASIAAARGLGAVVRAFDTRAAVKDEVKSLGAEFLEVELEEEGEGKGGYAKVMSKEFIEAEMALFRAQAPELDVVVTTALVPGTKAPILWDKTMVELMKPGSVIVDLAASQGGNCELTKAGEVVVHNGVKIIGYTDLASRMATTASQLYATNCVHLLDDMGKAADFKVDLEDVVVRTSMVTHEGEVTYPPPAIPEPTPKAKPLAPPPKEKAAPVAKGPSPFRWVMPFIGLGLVAAWLVLLILEKTQGGGGAIAAVKDPAREFVQHLTVFILAVFIGWQVVWNVTPALHTPLMSVTNAISGIIIVGGIIEGGRSGELTAPVILGIVAALVATINIAGGFLVTQRMLKMFRKG